MIKFSEYIFEGPFPLEDVTFPASSGVFVILKMDEKKISPIYFGQSSKFTDKGFKTHHKKQCWVVEAGSEENLLVATYLVPYSSESARYQIVKRLVSEYNTTCNYVQKDVVMELQERLDVAFRNYKSHSTKMAHFTIRDSYHIK